MVHVVAVGSRWCGLGAGQGGGLVDVCSLAEVTGDLRLRDLSLSACVSVSMCVCVRAHACVRVNGWVSVSLSKRHVGADARRAQSRATARSWGTGQGREARRALMRGAMAPCFPHGGCRDASADRCNGWWGRRGENVKAGRKATQDSALAAAQKRSTASQMHASHHRSRGSVGFSSRRALVKS